GMTLEEVEREAVGAHVETAPALHERDDRGHGERALDDLGQRLAGRHALPVARRHAADRLVAVGVANARDLRVAVAVRLHGRVPAQLARGVALGTKAPRVRLRRHGARVVHEPRAVRLLDRAPRELRGLLLQRLQHAPAHQPVALADRPLPAELGAAVHGVDAGQAAHVPGDDTIHGEEDRGRRPPRAATTKAFGIWPREASVTAITAASRTSGWRSSTCSISTALIVQPAEMMTSSERPAWCT